MRNINNNHLDTNHANTDSQTYLYLARGFCSRSLCGRRRPGRRASLEGNPPLPSKSATRPRSSGPASGFRASPSRRSTAIMPTSLSFGPLGAGRAKPPFRTSNELHQKFKDKGFVVIGQNVWEKSEATVEPFVKKMAGKMTYRVALDDKSGGGNGRMAGPGLRLPARTAFPPRSSWTNRASSSGSGIRWTCRNP